MASHEMVPSPSAPRPSDPLVRDLADGLRHIEYNYAREGSGPGSRFEGRLLEDVQAEWVMRELARSGHGEPVPRLVVTGQVTLECHGHDLVTPIGGGAWTTVSLRTLVFEARRHVRETHDG